MEAVNQTLTRRSLTWKMISLMEGSIDDWYVWGEDSVDRYYVDKSTAAAGIGAVRRAGV